MRNCKVTCGGQIKTEEPNGYVLSEVIVSIIIAAIAIGGLIFGLRTASDAQIKANIIFTESLDCQQNIEMYRGNRYQASNLVDAERDSFTVTKQPIEIILNGNSLILPKQFGGVTLASISCGLPETKLIETFVLEPF